MDRLKTRIGTLNLLLGSALLTHAPAASFAENFSDCPLIIENSKQAASLEVAINHLSRVNNDCKTAIKQRLKLDYTNLTSGLGGIQNYDSESNTRQNLILLGRDTLIQYQSLMNALQENQIDKCSDELTKQSAIYGISRHVAGVALSATASELVGIASGLLSIASGYIFQNFSRSGYEQELQKLESEREEQKMACEYLRYAGTSLCMDKFRISQKKKTEEQMVLTSCQLATVQNPANSGSLNSLLTNLSIAIEDLSKTRIEANPPSLTRTEATLRKLQDLGKQALGDSINPSEGPDTPYTLAKIVKDAISFYTDNNRITEAATLSELEKIFLANLSKPNKATLNPIQLQSTLQGLQRRAIFLRQAGFGGLLDEYLKRTSSSNLPKETISAAIQASEERVTLMRQVELLESALENFQETISDPTINNRVFNMMMSEKSRELMESYLENTNRELASKHYTEIEKCKIAVKLVRACAYLPGAFYFGRPRGDTSFWGLVGGDQNHAINSMQSSRKYRKICEPYKDILGAPLDDLDPKCKKDGYSVVNDIKNSENKIAKECSDQFLTQQCRNLAQNRMEGKLRGIFKTDKRFAECRESATRQPKIPPPGHPNPRQPVVAPGTGTGTMTPGNGGGVFE